MDAEFTQHVARSFPLHLRAASGFTLIEVLIAMAITAVVSVLAYGGLSSAMNAVDQLRVNRDRSYEINRAWMIISRDLRQFAPRPVRDEFGEVEAAFTGGELARFELSFTRAGWHNPSGYPRSTLQRVNYRVEDDGLWRDSYPVLDRSGDTEPTSVLLLAEVESMDLAFLGSLEALRQRDDEGLDTASWPETWAPEVGTSGRDLRPPLAMQITLQLYDWGEMRRLYVLSDEE